MYVKWLGVFFTYDTYIPNVIIMLANSIKTIGKYSNQVLGTYFLPTKVSLKYVELDKGAEFPEFAENDLYNVKTY